MKKRRIFLGLLLVIALAAFAGCSSNDGNGIDPDTPNVTDNNGGTGMYDNNNPNAKNNNGNGDLGNGGVVDGIEDGVDRAADDVRRAVDDTGRAAEDLVSGGAVNNNNDNL